MKEKLDAATETALCGGLLAALLWGIGLSLRGFVLGPLEISWAEWMIQLVAGMGIALLLPPAFVRGTAWVMARIDSRHSRRGLSKAA